MQESSQQIPSIQYCITGVLGPSEKYNQNVHNYGYTILQRAPQILEWYTPHEIETWINNHQNETRFMSNYQLLEIHRVLYPIPTPSDNNSCSHSG